MRSRSPEPVCRLHWSTSATLSSVTHLATSSGRFNRRDSSPKQSSTSPNLYFLLVYARHTVKDAKSLEESFPYVRARGEPGRDGEIRGEPREIQRSFLVKKLVSEACHVVARCSQHPLPMMVACSTHDEAFIKNYSRVFAGKTRRSVESNRLILSRTRYRCDSIGRMELFRYDWTRNGVRRVPWKLSAVHEQRRRHGRTP